MALDMRAILSDRDGVTQRGHSILCARYLTAAVVGSCCWHHGRAGALAAPAATAAQTRKTGETSSIPSETREADIQAAVIEAKKSNRRAIDVGGESGAAHADRYLRTIMTCVTARSAHVWTKVTGAQRTRTKRSCRSIRNSRLPASLRARLEASCCNRRGHPNR